MQSIANAESVVFNPSEGVVQHHANTTPDTSAVSNQFLTTDEIVSPERLTQLDTSSPTNIFLLENKLTIASKPSHYSNPFATNNLLDHLLPVRTLLTLPHLVVTILIPFKLMLTLTTHLQPIITHSQPITTHC